MKKRYYIVIVSVFFILFTGVAYSSWTYNFNIINKITTYDFSALVKVDELNISKSLDKDETCEIEIPLLKQNTKIDFENTGTIPIYIYKIQVSYEGANGKVLKNINYSGLVSFNASSLSKENFEIQMQKQDIYLEPKGTSEMGSKCKLSKELICNNNIFEDYNTEINEINNEISGDKSKKDELSGSTMSAITLPADNIEELTRCVKAKECEKTDLQNSVQKEKIKIKFFFERFNK